MGVRWRGRPSSHQTTFLKHGPGCCPAHLPALPLEHKGAIFKELALSPLAGNNARPEVGLNHASYPSF